MTLHALLIELHTPHPPEPPRPEGDEAEPWLGWDAWVATPPQTHTAPPARLPEADPLRPH